MKTNLRQTLWVVVPAAGIGTRFDPALAKQYAVMKDGRTVLDHTLTKLLQHELKMQVMLVLHEQDTQWPLSFFYASNRVSTTMGGCDRAHSVFNGLLALSEHVAADDWVLIHDACRPYVSIQDINQLLSLIDLDHPVGGLLAVPLTDTIKEVKQHEVIRTVSRELLWRAQTPQLFRYGLLKKALGLALKQQHVITDESSAIEQLGLHPVVIRGSVHNIKITYPEDLCE